MAKHSSSEEFEGAAPIPAPNTTPSPAHEKARARKVASTSPEPVAVSEPDGLAVEAELTAAKQSRKAKLKLGAALPSDEDVKPDYQALGVEEAEVVKYEELRLRFRDLGRRSTAQVFECGEVVAELQELAPDQESFTRRAGAVLGLSRRGAENYGNVYRNLQPYRARLVRAAMNASSLYDLATAEPERIEEVLAAREAGRKLTAAEIKAMAGKGGAPAASPDDGGLAGLKARIAEKTAIACPEVMDNAAALLEATLVALEPHRRGKWIVVKDTQRPFIHPARLLREQLEWLTWTAVSAPTGYAEGAIHHQPVADGDRWAELHSILKDLGGYEDWPAASEVGPWLNDIVVPQLAWLLGERAKKCFAIVDRIAAEAEAERLKAEKARERAKAEEKKAREKTKREKLKAEKRAAREAKAAAKAQAAIAPTPAEEVPAVPVEA